VLFAVGIVCVLLALGAPAFASSPCFGDAVVPSSATASRAALMLACDVNVIRTRNGLATLRVDEQLWTVARDQAADMARSGNLSHVDSAGRDLAARVAASGYLSAGGDGMVLENIGWGDGGLATPASIVEAWMASDEHRTRLLDPDVTDFAVGVAAGSDGVYYAADFGATDSRSAGETRTQARRRLRKRRRAAHRHRRHRHHARTGTRLEYARRTFAGCGSRRLLLRHWSLSSRRQWCGRTMALRTQVRHTCFACPVSRFRRRPLTETSSPSGCRTPVRGPGRSHVPSSTCRRAAICSACSVGAPAGQRSGFLQGAHGPFA
jgi:hypothetical protein